MICFIGRPDGPAIAGTAEILANQSEVWRTYRGYWRTHPLLMSALLGLRIAVEVLLHARVVVRVQPDEPNPLA